MIISFIIERFDIHTSTIIRTEESRTMGAKFIDDVDNIASNERCLKLCCETNECDVFIFEEKVSNKKEHAKSCLFKESSL